MSMERAKVVRGLRIAVSAMCGILCALLIVLWVRSYWAHEVVWGWFPFAGYLQVDSSCGVVEIIANAEHREFLWRFKSLTAKAFNHDWVFNLDRNSRFGWWLNITVPHWFLAILFASFGAVPWIRWSKRFSLRTLLTATALIAVALGLAVWWLR